MNVQKVMKETKNMEDSSLNTYAISLQFPQDINQIISSAVKSIAVATENTFIIEKNIPPHITLGAFHALKNDESKLILMVEEFSKKQKASIIQFKEIGNFKKKVLFLKPEKNAFLSQINSELHLLMLSEFEKAENGYYLPENWLPHTTLATRLNKSQFEKALEIAEKIRLPLETCASEIAVYQCSPFKELKCLKATANVAQLLK